VIPAVRLLLHREEERLVVERPVVHAAKKPEPALVQDAPHVVGERIARDVREQPRRVRVRAARIAADVNDEASRTTRADTLETRGL
jgi:hypothetical protein